MFRGWSGLGFWLHCTLTILSPVSMRCLSVAITGSPAPTVACTQNAGCWKHKMLKAEGTSAGAADVGAPMNRAGDVHGLSGLSTFFVRHAASVRNCERSVFVIGRTLGVKPPP